MDKIIKNFENLKSILNKKQFMDSAFMALIFLVVFSLLFADIFDTLSVHYAQYIHPYNQYKVLCLQTYYFHNN